MTICNAMSVIDTDINLFFSQPFCTILNLSRYEPTGDRWVEMNSRYVDTEDKYLLTCIVYAADKSKVNASSRNLWKKKNISSPNSPHWREHRRQNRGWTSPVFISISTPWWRGPSSTPDGERSYSLLSSTSVVFFLFPVGLWARVAHGARGLVKRW